MHNTEFQRCVDEDLASPDPDIRRLAIQRLHVLIFGHGVSDQDAAKAALRGMAEHLMQALKE